MRTYTCTPTHRSPKPGRALGLGCTFTTRNAFIRRTATGRPGRSMKGSDQDRQNEAERAGQDMAFHALDFLVAVEPPLTLLRAGDDALRIQDPGRRLRRAAVGSSHPSRQLGGGIRPHAVGPEPIVPRAYRLPRPEVDRQRPPWAARMLQVETGVHHLAHIGSEGKVAPEQRFDDIPFHVRQVT